MSGASECKRCGDSIVWLKTKSGKNIPVDDSDGVSATEVYDKARHSCHFDTCGRAGAKGPVQKKGEDYETPEDDMKPGF